MQKNQVMPFCLCMLLLGFAMASKAQSIVKKPGITFGANFIYADPKGQFGDYYRYGAGAEAYGGLGWGSTYLVATIGLTSYQNKPGLAGKATVVPLKFGLKKYIFLKRIFIDADLDSASIKVDDAKVRAFTGGIGAGIRLLGAEASLYYNTFRNKAGYSMKGYSNSLQVGLGWSFSI